MEGQDIKAVPDGYYSVIKEETLRMERLIKDLMDLSLLQAGKVDIIMDELDLADLIQRVVEKLLYRAKEKKVNLKVHQLESIGGRKISASVTKST